jgi:hypothetical protein
MVVGLDALMGGGIALGSSDGRAATWISRDANLWTLDSIDGAGSDTRAHSAAGTLVRRVVATRNTSTLAGGLWLFDDGRWEEVGRAPAFPAGFVVRDINWNGDRFLTVGAIHAREDDLQTARPAAWTSSDGREWRREHLPVAAGQLVRVAERDDRAVAVGSFQAGPTEDGLVLVRDSERWGLAQAQDVRGSLDESVTRILVNDQGWLASGVVQPAGCRSEGCVDRKHRYWTSLDGQIWEVFDARGRTTTPFGARTDAYLGEREFGEGSIVLRSRDAASWVPISPVFKLPPGAMLASFEDIEGHVIAAGSQDGRAAFWRSPTS